MSSHPDPDAPDPRFAPTVEDADALIAEALAAVEARLGGAQAESQEPAAPAQAPAALGVEIEVDVRAFDNTIPPDDGDEPLTDPPTDPGELIFDPGAWGEPPPSAVDEANARAERIQAELDLTREKLRSTREKGRRLNERHQALAAAWEKLRAEHHDLRLIAVRQERQLAELREAQNRFEDDRKALRHRHQKELDEGRRFAHDKLLRELLPVLDNLDVSLSHTEASPAHAAEGLRMIASQLVRTLERHGVERVSAAAGDRFDPHLHEAIAYLSSADASPGCILETHQGGWALNGRLIRPARVSVARADSAPAPDPSAEAEPNGA